MTASSSRWLDTLSAEVREQVEAPLRAIALKAKELFGRQDAYGQLARETMLTFRREIIRGTTPEQAAASADRVSRRIAKRLGVRPTYAVVRRCLRETLAATVPPPKEP